MARAPGRGRVETIRRQFLVELTGDGDPARHQVTSLDEVHQLLDHWVRKACHQRGALPDRADPPPVVGGRRRSRSAGRRAATGGARLGGACHRVAPEPSQNSYSHFAGDAVPERPAGRHDCSDRGTGRRVEVCPALAGQRRTRATGAGCWVLGEDARDGDRGSQRRGWPAGTQIGTKPGRQLGPGVSPAAGRPLAKRLRPAAWPHLKRMEGSAGSGGGLGCRAYAGSSTCSGSLNEFPIGSRPYASLEIALLHFLAPRGGTDDRSHGESTQ